MADVKFEVVTGTLNASGTSDFTIAGFGTPKAAIVISPTVASADGVLQTVFNYSIGFTDGVIQYCGSSRSRHNVAASSTYKGLDTTAIVVHRQDNGSALEGAAQFGQWITDGVQLSVNNTFLFALEITVILIGGADVANVSAGHANMGTAASPVPVTGLGHPTSLLFALNPGIATIGTPVSTNRIVFGVGINDGNDTQMSFGSGESNNQNPSNTTMQVRDARISGVQGTSYDVAVSSFTSDGFTLTPNNSAGDHLLAYLAIELTGSPSLALFAEDGPVTTGSHLTTAPGFQPTFGMYLVSDAAVVNSEVDGISIGFVAFDAASSISAVTSAQDNVSPTNVGTKLAVGFEDLTLGSTVLHSGTFTGFNANGWEFNFTTAPGTARKWIGFAVGDAAPEGNPVDYVTSSIPPDGFSYADVTSIAKVTDANNLLNGLTPAAAVGDQIEYQNPDDDSHATSVDGFGHYILDASTGVHIWQYTIYDQTDGTWGTSATITTTSDTLSAPVAPTITPQSDPENVAVDTDLTAGWSGNPAPTFVFTGLPTGLIDDGDGTVSGTPTVVGNYSVTMTGTNSEGSDFDTFNWEITETPTSPVQTTSYSDRSSVVDLAVNISLGDPYWSSNAGAMTYAVGIGTLPTGLTMDSAGIVTGTPTVNGDYAGIRIDATNSEGTTQAGETFTWSIIDAPDVTIHLPFSNGLVADYVQPYVRKLDGYGI